MMVAIVLASTPEKLPKHRLYKYNHKGICRNKYITKLAKLPID